MIPHIHRFVVMVRVRIAPKQRSTQNCTSIEHYSPGGRRARRPNTDDTSRHILIVARDAFPDDLLALQVRVLRAWSRYHVLSGVQFVRMSLTTRRLVHIAQPCLLGCLAIGGEDVRHFLVVVGATAALAARPPA